VNKPNIVRLPISARHETGLRRPATKESNQLLACDACHILLKSWNSALKYYAQLVGDLIKARSYYYSEIYDRTADALESASEAKCLYDLHCKEHALESGKIHLVACRRQIVTTDAVVDIGVFPANGTCVG
jgi:hypothetical protein